MTVGGVLTKDGALRGLLSVGQKEMLVPIDGRKPGKETAAKKPGARSQRKSA
jgi:hypothetical protein